MTGLGPWTQRLLAWMLALGVLIVLASWIIFPVVDGIQAKRQELALLRMRSARLEAVAEWPDTTRPTLDSRLFVQGSPAIASATITRHVEALAQAAGLTVQLPVIAPASGDSRQIDAEIRTSGSEEAVVGFIAALEQNRPLMRVISLAIKPTSPDGDTVEATMHVSCMGEAAR